MAKYFHISMYKRNDKVGLRLGGVANFARYLNRAVPEMKLISFSDFPRWALYKESPDYEKAKVMNDWLLHEGIVGTDSVVVVDGFWGLGLAGRVERLISVCHGSYYGRFIQSQINPWGTPENVEMMKAQFELWNDDGVEIVCVCETVEKEIEKSGLVGAKVIYHGIPLDVYRPMGMSGDKVFMHGAEYFLKGFDVVDGLSVVAPDLVIEKVNEYSGVDDKMAQRLNQAKAMIVPSHYEGCPYLCMEALACGVPLIAHAVGAIREMDSRCGFVTDDLSVANFLRLIQTFDEYPGRFSPREYAEEYFDFERFAGEWRTHLEIAD